MFTRKEQQEIRHRLKIFAEAKACNNVSFVCRRYGISRDTFYRWKRNFKLKGEQGLVNSKPCPQNPSIRVSPEIEEKNSLFKKTLPFWPFENRLVYYALP